MHICSVLFFVIDYFETWSVAEDNLVDNSFVIVVISQGDFMHICSVLSFEIEELETWSVAEDNLVDNPLVIVVISEGDSMHICSVLFFVIEDLEIWSVAEDNLEVLLDKTTNLVEFGDFVLVFLLIWYLEVWSSLELCLKTFSIIIIILWTIFVLKSFFTTTLSSSFFQGE